MPLLPLPKNTTTPITATPPSTPSQPPNSATPNNAAAPITAKTWELSDYELQRIPQEAITDNTEIAVSPRALHSELMCPICLDMLHQTMTTKGEYYFQSLVIFKST